MSSRDRKLYIDDIHDAIRKRRQYTDGLSYETFLRNELVVDAVLRNIIVMGEAARNVPPIEQHYPNIPWAQMRAIRNVVAHGYFQVNSRIVCDTIRQTCLPCYPCCELYREAE